MRIYVPMLTTGKHVPDPTWWKTHFESLASPGTEIICDAAQEGPVAIESTCDAAMCIPSLIERVKTANESGLDAVIIHCMADPGLTPAREVSRIPVVGLAETSIIVALSLGRRFSILNPTAHPAVFGDLVRLYGLEARLASIRQLNIPVKELTGGQGKHLRRIEAEGRKAVEEDGADVLVMGCGFMSGISRQLEARLGVPAVDPDATAIAYAEMLVRLGLHHSKKAYPFPL